MTDTLTPTALPDVRRTMSVESPYAMSAEDVVLRLGSNADQGLSDADAAARLTDAGPNELAAVPPPPIWQRFLGQFKELVIWILIVAAFISGFMGEWIDTAAISAIVILNAVIGFFQEERAERALSALQKLSAPMAKVRREGVLRSIAARELVPGDVIELEAGDNIPADARLIESFGLRIQESALTGESVAVTKDADAELKDGAALGDRRNMAYLGTVATAGKAKAVVTAGGMNTQLGQIAGMLQQQESQPTPLQRRLTELGRILIVVCLAIVVVVFALQMLRGGELAEVFLLSVSLAVAAVPEGLPAVVTIALALGLQRMVRRNALIRKLPSVETLGSVTVICSDKTGTLTRNEMTVRAVMAGESIYRVTGSGYAPRGSFIKPADENVRTAVSEAESSEDRTVRAADEDDLMQALRIGAFCNNAKLTPPDKRPDVWQVIGDPTEGALIVAAMKAGIDEQQRGRIVSEIPFDSERKAMSVVIRHASGSPVMYTKGAPEVIVSLCTSERINGRTRPLTDARKQSILQINSDMASQALRVLALAYRENPAVTDGEFQESDLVFAGLVGMIDPPRDEARQAVRRCAEAGIRPVMITGDHPATALAVARELGMTLQDSQAVTGRELNAMTDRELESRVDQTPVYARVSAEHKIRVIDAWQRRGHVVAMTGDGVNDAPAVKSADIGIAMGITGTDVTKEASDMVLTDDNFASIVNAVEEGRGIYDNIQKVLSYLLSCNFGEILLMLIASLVGWPAPLLPIQLLWINLVTDGLPALALALEPPEPLIMQRPPRPPREPVLTLGRISAIALQGMLVCGAALTAFAISYTAHPDQLERARALAFCVLVYAELFRALAARSQRYTLWQLGVFTNPYLLIAIVVSGLLQLSITVAPFVRPVFGLGTHAPVDALIVIALALMPVTVIEAAKWIRWGWLSGAPGERDGDRSTQTTGSTGEHV